MLREHATIFEVMSGNTHEKSELLKAKQRYLLEKIPEEHDQLTFAYYMLQRKI